jgi:hypothetical protein
MAKKLNYRITELGKQALMPGNPMQMNIDLSWVYGINCTAVIEPLRYFQE